MSINSNAKSENDILTAFCIEQDLPEQYAEASQSYFFKLAEKLSDLSNQANKTIIIGINGCQGSGKSTLSALLEALLTQYHGKNVANLSIDDFYHTHEFRETLAKDLHPLFITRGVPGTHDIGLLNSTLKELSQNKKDISIVRFNKASDDRQPPSLWDRCHGPVDIIILEGWCIGVTEQSTEQLSQAINDLEKEEDEHSLWRNTINHFISSEYQPLFSTLDFLIMLKAPSFACVFNWRQKQEEKLIKAIEKTSEKKTGIMNKKELQRFIEHYQRLTIHMLKVLPSKADIIYELNEDHQITGCHANEHP